MGKQDVQQVTRKEAHTPNSILAKWRLTCFYDSLVLNQSVVLRLNFCAKNARPNAKPENVMGKFKQPYRSKSPTLKGFTHFRTDLEFAEVLTITVGIS